MSVLKGRYFPPFFCPSNALDSRLHEEESASRLSLFRRAHAWPINAGIDRCCRRNNKLRNLRATSHPHLGARGWAACTYTRAGHAWDAARATFAPELAATLRGYAINPRNSIDLFNLVAWVRRDRGSLSRSTDGALIRVIIWGSTSGL